ncbi:peptidase M23 [Pseudidiomarina aestuarii]|uniref:Peptidase M23 n=1 Tax=Pseudidiomarina aestuarii TaxID=624146 RepID=A0A7Z7EUS0_9GAMM|nr:M23 family metallopeptidase [Pseudidiomarina aestuarii]RUO42054.1 peptidase M23 [Pseudidiomarina aestuarii]
MMTNYRWHIATVLAVMLLTIWAFSAEDSGDTQNVAKIPQALAPFDAMLVLPEPNTTFRHVEAQRKVVEPTVMGKLITLRAGQNLSTLLGQQGVTSRQVTLLAQALRPLLNVGKLQAGIVIDFHQANDEQPLKLRLAREYGEVVEAVYKDDSWSVALTEVPTYQEVDERGFTIRHSLYRDADAVGVPLDIISSAIMALSHFIDFQRQVQANDVMEVRYQRTLVQADHALFNHLQTPLELTYLRFTNEGEDHRLIRFNDSFYSPDGKLAESFLLKTPLNGARLSSYFGNRRHPVLGYNRAHKGIDFSAPVGTPIMAAGRGVVKRANRFSSFGNTVIIDHGNGYETLYAHLNGFKKGLRVGDKVKQGDVIGYLGNTGLSAGRHLHYEVHKDGRAINPLNLKAPSSLQLSGDELIAFEQHVERLYSVGSRLASLTPDDEHAQGASSRLAK